MIKRNQQVINVVNMLLDAALLYCACSFLLPASSIGRAAVFAVSYWLFLALLRFYNGDRLYRLDQRAARIVIAGVLSTAILALLSYDLAAGSAAVRFGLLFLASVLLLLGKYILMFFFLRALRERGWNIKHIAVIGTGQSAVRFARDTQDNPKLGYHVFGFVGRENAAVLDSWLCDFDGLEDFLYDTDADEIVIALEPDEAALVRMIIPQCERSGLRFSLILEENDLLTEKTELHVIGGSKLLTPRSGRLDNIGWAFLKRLFDIVMSALGILILSPLMLMIAVGVRLSGPGPILFRQERVGKNRKVFTMLKFRSMRPNEMETTAWTGPSDPRRTFFGKWIRKLSLDELPQLFNVLTGSMSLIGPRPELPYFVEQYRKTIPLYMKKHQVRPGITGWAQVNGLRGDTNIEDRIAHDLWYIENWTPWLDIRIIFKTVFGGMINRETLRETAASVSAKQ